MSTLTLAMTLVQSPMTCGFDFLSMDWEPQHEIQLVHYTDCANLMCAQCLWVDHHCWSSILLLGLLSTLLFIPPLPQ